jgi:lysosomal alpha-mannosidase
MIFSDSETSSEESIVEFNNKDFRSKRATDHEMKGKGFTLHLDNTSGKIKSIKLDNGKTVPFGQSFKYYRAHQDSSYQFCPEGYAIDFSVVKLESKYDNGLIHEVRQHWNEWVSQTIRVYEDEEYIEFDWTVGPIPVDDKIGKEVITRFETNLNNEKVFYTDANGRQMV